MKIKKSVEQAVCILIMLASQKDHKPLKSYTLSTRLEVSDSYLKKIMRKLVVHDLVISEAGKEGGFILKGSPESISMLDIYHAIEGDEPMVQLSHLARKVFLYENTVTQRENEVLEYFSEAEKVFFDKLDEYKLAHLLHDLDYENGFVDWEEVVANQHN